MGYYKGSIRVLYYRSLNNYLYYFGVYGFRGVRV